MAVRADGRSFSISTPQATISLGPNRTSEVPFTVTNLTGHLVRARAFARPLDGAPADWFTISGEAEPSFGADQVKQVQVLVDPALGAPAGRYAFRLDLISVERPTEEFAEGPACAVDVPAGGTGGLTEPRGYLATLVGASVGGALLLLVVIGALIFIKTTVLDCEDLGGCIGEAIGLVILFAFLLLVGTVLMWIASAIGIWFALRRKRYRGAKLTAVFFAVLMVPWTVLLVVVLELLDVSGTVALILLPLVMLVVPAVIARALVLLIRTHHI